MLFVGRSARAAWAALVVVILTAAVPLQAQDAAYLREMPTADRVVADISGADPMDTRARQVAALSRLFDVVKDMAGSRYSTGPFPTAGEKRVRDDYLAAITRLRSAGLATFPQGATGLDSPRARWMASIEAYQRDPEFQQELFGRYLAPATQARLGAAVGERTARSAAGAASITRGLRELSGVRETRWEQQTPEERQSAIAFGVLMLALLAFGVVRECLPFAVVDGRPPAIRTGLRRRRLASATGIVADHTWRDDTRLDVEERQMPDGTVKRTVTSTTRRTEEFDLVGEGGTRHHVTAEYYVGARETPYYGPAGSPLTAVWRHGRWRKTTPYLTFFQPDPPVAIRDPASAARLQRLLSPYRWTLLPAMGFGFLIGSVTDSLGPLIPVDASNFRGFAIALLVVPPWLILHMLIGSARERRFVRVELPRLHAILHGRPAE